MKPARGVTVLAAAVVLVCGPSTPPVSAGNAPKCFGKVATIVGTDDSDFLQGTPQADVIVDGHGSDTIRGLGGNDRICAGRHEDEIFGGKGNDLLDAGSGAYRQQMSGGPGDDLLKNGHEVSAGPGNDRIIASRERGYSPSFFGGPGGDFIRAFERGDFLVGGRGNDTLNGGRGSDSLRAGPGNDRILGGPGSDTFTDDDWDAEAPPIQATGSDLLDGGPGSDLWRVDSLNNMHVDLRKGRAWGAGRDRLRSILSVWVGGETNDRLIGNAERNHFRSSNGSDVIKGMGGNDRLEAPDFWYSEDELGDEIFGGTGDDHARGEGGPDKIEGGEGKDHLNGGEGDDRLAGQGGQDHLNGAEGVNENLGGPGTDTCISPAPGEPGAQDCELSES